MSKNKKVRNKKLTQTRPIKVIAKNFIRHNSAFVLVNKNDIKCRYFDKDLQQTFNLSSAITDSFKTQELSWKVCVFVLLRENNNNIVQSEHYYFSECLHSEIADKLNEYHNDFLLEFNQDEVLTIGYSITAGNYVLTNEQIYKIAEKYRIWSDYNTPCEDKNYLDKQLKEQFKLLPETKTKTKTKAPKSRKKQNKLRLGLIELAKNNEIVELTNDEILDKLNYKAKCKKELILFRTRLHYYLIKLDNEFVLNVTRKNKYSYTANTTVVLYTVKFIDQDFIDNQNLREYYMNSDQACGRDDDSLIRCVNKNYDLLNRVFS